MRLPQREHPDAAAELDAAVEWYEDREPGLGISLVDHAVAARDSIAEWPDAWPPFAGWNREPLVRSKKLDVFPFRVVYFVSTDDLVIVAYAHERRRPSYWIDRLDT